MVQGQVYIGQGLGLDALHRVHQYGNVAGCQGAADFIVEVHMSRGVCQVRDILLPGLLWNSGCKKRLRYLWGHAKISTGSTWKEGMKVGDRIT